MMIVAKLHSYGLSILVYNLEMKIRNPISIPLYRSTTQSITYPKVHNEHGAFGG
jgi:hypothetical protein